MKREAVVRGVKIALVAVLVVIALLVAVRWLAWRLGHVVTNAGFVKADITLVSPEVPARIEKILVDEGDRVTPGQLLVVLDRASLDDQVKVAEGKVAVMEGKVARYRAKLSLARREVPARIRAARAALEAARRTEDRARAREEYLRRQRDRFRGLLEDEAIGRARYEEIETGWKAAAAELAAARAGVAAARARLAEAEAARAKIAEAEGALAEAEGGLAAARDALSLARVARDKAEIRAPVGGVVARVFPEPGDLATPGRPVVAVYDPTTLYVEARFEETKLRHLRPGQLVTLELDALPGKPLRGRIRVIHRAAAGEFALIPRDVTAGEFTKLTQRVPVEISFLPGERDRWEKLLPGLSVTVAARKGGRDER